MSSIADQVAALEKDNAKLLNEKAMLQQQLAVMENEKMLALQQLDTALRFTAGTRKMVEELAGQAYELLRHSKREAYEKPKGGGPDIFAPAQEQRDVEKAGVRPVREIERNLRVGVEESRVARTLADSPTRGDRTVRQIMNDERLPAPQFLRRDTAFEPDAELFVQQITDVDTRSAEPPRQPIDGYAPRQTSVMS